MNLLVLTNLYPPHYVGGYELHCQLIVDALRARGHQVKVLTSDHRLEGVTDRDAPSVSRQLKIHGLFGHPFLNIFDLQKLEAHNNLVLRKTIAENPPDLVFVWAMSGLSKSMLQTLERLRIPTAFAVCDHWIARSREADVWLNWWEKSDGHLSQKALRAFWEMTGKRKDFDVMAPTGSIRNYRFRRLYFCSEALRNFTRDAGFNVSHGAVIYCPLDIEKFHGVPRDASHPMRNLMFAGRLHPDKGIFTALKAMKLLRNRFPGTLGVFGSGDSSFEQEIKTFVTREKLPVTFHPAAPPDDMPGIYRRHDALLFTSEWAEPFALTPLEAMACGLPVIGTTTGGSGELFRHRDNCLTYTAGDPGELAQRILELEENPALRERIARTGHEEVRIRFAATQIVEQVESYLAESLHQTEPTIASRSI